MSNMMLFTELSGFRVLVLANRLGCDNDIARNVHERLAAKLAEMIEGQRKILEGKRARILARGSSEEEDAALDLDYYRSTYYEKWLIEPVALLNDHMVDHSTNEYFDFRAGRWYFCDGVLPIVEPVRADKLCGLAEIIARIEDVSGVAFTVEHVYYSEEEAEAAWWQATGADPEEFFGSAEAASLP